VQAHLRAGRLVEADRLPFWVQRTSVSPGFAMPDRDDLVALVEHDRADAALLRPRERFERRLLDRSSAGREEDGAPGRRSSARAGRS
jgi:hypothetical protein